MITLEQKNKYMEHQIAVLKSILKNNQPSDKSVNVDITSEYFEDSCRHSELYYGLKEFVETLEKMVKYNEIIIAAEKNNK